MRAAATLAVLCAVMLCNGCIIVPAAVAALGAAVLLEKKNDHPAATPPAPAGGPARESSAGLARAGMVVIVDVSTGTKAELSWQQGMRLATAAMQGNFNGNFRTATIFRDGRPMTADLQGANNGGADLLLHAGDVVELRR